MTERACDVAILGAAGCSARHAVRAMRRRGGGGRRAVGGRNVGAMQARARQRDR